MDAEIITNVVDGNTINSTLVMGQPITSDLEAGAKGDKGDKGDTGDTGATGGIVPITVSATAPVDPDVNDLWIDLS